MQALIITCFVTLVVAGSYNCADGQVIVNGTTDMLLDIVHRQDDRIQLLERALEELKSSCQPQFKLADRGNIPHQTMRGLQILFKAGGPYTRIRGPFYQRSYDKIGRTRQSGGFVGFTAYLDHDIYHLGVGQTIVFDKLILNEGNAYSPYSGHFTSPAAGFYGFSFTVYINSTQQIVTRLMIDGVNQLDAIADAYHPLQEIQGGNFLVTHLQPGQVVSIQNYRWADKEIDGSKKYHMGSFSGFLIA